MAECQLHRVGTAGLRALVHQLQLQWTSAMYSFVQRFRYSDSADGRTECTCLQHRRVARPAHPVDPRLAAIHRREDPHHGAALAIDAGGA